MFLGKRKSQVRVPLTWQTDKSHKDDTDESAEKGRGLYNVAMALYSPQQSCGPFQYSSNSFILQSIRPLTQPLATHPILSTHSTSHHFPLRLVSLIPLTPLCHHSPSLRLLPMSSKGELCTNRSNDDQNLGITCAGQKTKIDLNFICLGNRMNSLRGSQLGSTCTNK